MVSVSAMYTAFVQPLTDFEPGSLLSEIYLKTTESKVDQPLAMMASRPIHTPRLGYPIYPA